MKNNIDTEKLLTIFFVIIILGVLIAYLIIIQNYIIMKLKKII